MTKYSYVEDYLELLAGYEPNNLLNQFTYSLPGKIVKLARYDISVVENMANNTIWGTALTDRQAELAVKLILKYRRQFAAKGIDVSPVETPTFRIPIRKIDRTKSIILDQDLVKIRFPYDQKYIDAMQNLQKQNKGLVTFDRHSKTWQSRITEYTINYLVAWGEANDFAICDGVRSLMNIIDACGQTSYEIKLVTTDQGFAITNAAKSLVDYVDNHIGGFAHDNVIKLVDHAGLLGYTVDDSILAQVPGFLTQIGPNHSTHLSPTSENFERILDYAKLTNRYPICIYEPGAIGVNSTIDLSQFSEQDILRFDHNGKTKTRNYNLSDVKIVHAKKIPSHWNFSVPLLVTTVEMMYGGRRVDWTRRAERIIYFTNAMLRDTA